MAIPLVVTILALLGLLLVGVGLVGLVLLIVGIAKRKTALWVIGIVCLVPAVLAVVFAVPALLFLGVAVPVNMKTTHVRDEPAIAAESGEGDFVRTGDGRGTARVAGVDIEVLEPGGGGSGSSTTSSHGLGGVKEDHEVRLGDVRIHIHRENGARDLAVDGRDCGRVEPGDQVLVTEDRRVLVNGERR